MHELRLSLPRRIFQCLGMQLMFGNNFDEFYGRCTNIFTPHAMSAQIQMHAFRSATMSLLLLQHVA
jgi:hypothetical protein